MHLKKLVWLALLLPIVASGKHHEEWKPDEVLLKNLWKEVKKITEINPNTPKPPLIFNEKIDPEKKALGRFSVKDRKMKMEIFIGSIQKLINLMRNN